MSLEQSLTARLLRREGLQLGLIAVVTAVVLLFDSRPLQVIAGIVDVVVCAIAAVALIVAWRVSKRGSALVVYALAVPLFALLALFNLRG
jgi:hypothetical protein